MLTKRITIAVRPLAEKLLPFFLFALAVWAIGDGLPSLKDMKIRSLVEAWPLITFLLLGSVLNQGVEAYKWFLLGKSGPHFSYKNACKGVLAGLAIGMWMPGRVGAWLGKLHFVPSGRRSSALFPLMVSSGMQFAVTLIAAIGSLLLLGSGITGDPNALLSSRVLLFSGLFAFLFLIGGWGFYRFLHARKGRSLLERAGFQAEKLHSFRALSYQLYGKVFAVAALRYAVFFFQFLVALLFWVPQAPLMGFALGIPVVLFIVSVLPSFVLAKLGVREMVVVAVMAPLCGHEEQLLLASFSIWLVNLAIPALFGGMLLLRSRVPFSRQLQR